MVTDMVGHALMQSFSSEEVYQHLVNASTGGRSSSDGSTYEPVAQVPLYHRAFPTHGYKQVNNGILGEEGSALTYCLTQPLSHLLTHSATIPLTHPLTHTLTHSLTQPRFHSATQPLSPYPTLLS